LIATLDGVNTVPVDVVTPTEVFEVKVIMSLGRAMMMFPEPVEVYEALSVVKLIERLTIKSWSSSKNVRKNCSY
jgi:hypothetical protein